MTSRTTHRARTLVAARHAFDNPDTGNTEPAGHDGDRLIVASTAKVRTDAATGCESR